MAPSLIIFVTFVTFTFSKSHFLNTTSRPFNTPRQPQPAQHVFPIIRPRCLPRNLLIARIIPHLAFADLVSQLSRPTATAGASWKWRMLVRRLRDVTNRHLVTRSAGSNLSRTPRGRINPRPLECNHITTQGAGRPRTA